LGFGFLENNRDASEPLWLVKDQPNRLNTRLSRLPASPLLPQKRRFNGKGIVFGRYFDRCSAFQIEPPLLMRWCVKWPGNNPFAHFKAE
jgi:hypothetical protein